MADQQPQPGACNTCGGAKGHVEETRHDGVVRQTWHTCTSCNGSGIQGGGH